MNGPDTHFAWSEPTFSITFVSTACHITQLTTRARCTRQSSPARTRNRLIFMRFAWRGTSTSTFTSKFFSAPIRPRLRVLFTLRVRGDMCIDADLFYSFFSASPFSLSSRLAGRLLTFTSEPRTLTSSRTAQRNTLRNWGTCDDHGSSPRNNSDGTIDRILFGTTS